MKQTYILPFATDIRPSTKYDEQSGLLSGAKESGKILLPTEIIILWLRFVDVPRHIPEMNGKNISS